MNSDTMRTKTTSWFGSTTEHSGPSPPSQYALVASETIDLEASNMELVTGIADALMNVIEPAGGQTTLSLYEYVNPDALEDIITEVRRKRVTLKCDSPLKTISSLSGVTIPFSSTNRSEHNAKLMEIDAQLVDHEQRFSLLFTTYVEPHEQDGPCYSDP